MIPTYNEAGNIVSLLRKIHAQQLDVDILVIDDHSPDGTGPLVESLSGELPVRMLHRPGKLGIGSAHKDGFRYAIERGYTFVVTMDADFAHDPVYLSALLAQAGTADVVVGSRYLAGGGVSGWSLLRRSITYTAHWLTTMVLGLPYDCTGGFRLYQVKALRRIDYQRIRSDGYAFLIEMFYYVRRAGCSVREIPIVIPSRNCGESKISKFEILKAVATLLRLAVRPHRTARVRATPSAPIEA